MTEPRALTPAEQPPGAEHPRYPRLFSPLQVGPIQVKNRIVNSAHTTNFAHGGVYTEQLIAYHRERARGGAAIIVSQATNVVPEYGELRNVDDRIVDGIAAVRCVPVRSPPSPLIHTWARRTDHTNASYQKCISDTTIVIAHRVVMSASRACTPSPYARRLPR